MAKIMCSEYGVSIFSITLEQYLNPDKLFDELSQDPSVSAAGCFIARLAPECAPTVEHVNEQVNYIKDVLRKDVPVRAYAKQVCNPHKMLRGNVWAEKGVHSFSGVRTIVEKDKVKSYSALRSKFLDSVLNHPFLAHENAESSKLETAVKRGGIDAMLTEFYELIKGETTIMYGAGMRLPKPLATTATARMEDFQGNMTSLKRHNGISQPTVYIGAEGSVFCCHREDMAFQSVNRHIAGGEKTWFFVPPGNYESFQRMMTGFGANKNRCNVFLQHKWYFIDPRVVIANGIPVYTVRQNPGDIVYVSPNAIHFGINQSFCINEAVNTASNSWAPFGMNSLPICNCPDVDAELRHLDITPVLRSAGVQEGDLQLWSHDRLAGSLSEMSTMHPAHYRAFGNVVNPQNLYGQHIDPDVKVLTREYVSCEADLRTEMWGVGEDLTITVSDDEEDGVQNESETMDASDDATTNAAQSEQMDAFGDEAQHSAQSAIGSSSETDSDMDADLDQASSSQQVIPKCGKCGKTYTGYYKHQMTRLSGHINKKHKKDAMKLIQQLEESYKPPPPKMNKTQTCPICDKTLAGTPSNLSKHIQSMHKGSK